MCWRPWWWWGGGRGASSQRVQHGLIRQGCVCRGDGALGEAGSREWLCSAAQCPLTSPLSPGQSSMESERVPRKGRKLGSSRRRQIRELADGQDAPVAPETESWSSQAAAELQGFFKDCGAKERGFVTREDLAVSLRPPPTPESLFYSLLRTPIPGRQGLPAPSPSLF